MGTLENYLEMKVSHDILPECRGWILRMIVYFLYGDELTESICLFYQDMTHAIQICFRVQHLINLVNMEGADVNAESSIGWTPLQTVLRNANEIGDHTTAIVQALLEAGADVNALYNYSYIWTPLMQAIYNDNADTVKHLINAGADVNAVNSDGNGSLHVAALYASADIMRLLISAGANESITNIHSRTAMHIASVRINHAVLRDIFDVDGCVCWRCC